MVADVAEVADTVSPAGGGAPSSAEVLTGPCPVKKTEMTLPAAAGFSIEFTEPPALSACALPSAPVKRPGAEKICTIAR